MELVANRRAGRETVRSNGEPIEYRVVFALSFPVLLLSTTVRRLAPGRRPDGLPGDSSIVAEARSATAAVAGRTIPASFIG